MLKPGVRRAFNRAASSYEGAAEVQRQVVARLAELAAGAIVDTPLRIIDAGCGTGFALERLHARWPGAVILAFDLAERMLLQHRRDALHCRPVAADIERLPLADGSADLYWSSFTLQWCDLGRALAEARRVLTPGGRLALATVVDGTFAELRAAFSDVDNYSHSLDFLSAATVQASAAAAGFRDIAITGERVVTRYPDLRSLLDAVRQVGASGVAGRRRPGLLGKAAWQRIAAAWPRDPDGLLPLSYQVLYLTART